MKHFDKLRDELEGQHGCAWAVLLAPSTQHKGMMVIRLEIQYKSTVGSQVIEIRNSADLARELNDLAGTLLEDAKAKHRNNVLNGTAYDSDFTVHELARPSRGNDGKLILPS
ncbi:hypothetical protein GC174_14770 [bacterium]|nr:hypothetical protein [bacterium]